MNYLKNLKLYCLTYLEDIMPSALFIGVTTHKTSYIVCVMREFTKIVSERDMEDFCYKSKFVTVIRDETHKARYFMEQIMDFEGYVNLRELRGLFRFNKLIIDALIDDKLTKKIITQNEKYKYCLYDPLTDQQNEIPFEKIKIIC